MSNTAPNGTRAGTVSAARIALKLLRARRFAVIVAMVCTQGLLVWTMPFLQALLRASLAMIGVRGLNQYTLETVATSPLAIITIVAIGAVATVLVLAEITVFAVLAHLSLDGGPVTFRNVWHRTTTVARKAFSWQGLLLIPYLTVLLPISEIGFSSVLTAHIAIPKFISGELLKTTSGSIMYTVVTGAIVYLMLRFVLFSAIVSRHDVTIVQALRRSFRMTTWRPLAGFGAVMIAVLIVASLLLVVLVGLGVAPVAIWQTHTAAGIVIGLLELARFFVTGTAAAFLSFFCVAYVRVRHDQPARLPRALPVRHGTRATAAAFLVVAAFFASPQVVSAADAAVFAAGNSPDIIGHRGYPPEAVENSVAGIHAAADAGADVVETDIQETRDGGMVVFHDVDLARMTGDERKIYSLAEAQATGLTLRQDGRTADMPTLADFVEAADAQGIRLLIEVKPHGHEPPGFAGRVVTELNRLDPDRTHMVQSLDREVIDEIARIDPKRSTAHVVGFQIGGLPTNDSNSAAVIEDWSYTDRMRAAAKQNGRELYVWTVNDLDLLSDYLARGVDGVITDEVALAAKTRQKINSGPVTLYIERARGLVAVR